MANELRTKIPLGDLQLYDNYIPALSAGNWRIKVSHTLTGSDGKLINKDEDTLEASQEFVVSAPQFVINPNEIINQYPPANSAGRYSEVLPHIVLKEPLLPWERGMKGQDRAVPWLALLVFQEHELVGGPNSPTRVNTTDVKSFLTPDKSGKILKPAVNQEADVDDASACAFIQISTALFQQIAPRLPELRYLAHCRQANVSDKALQGLNQKGLFSVVVANRFPAAPTAGTATAIKHIVHLVSLEGVESYLVDNPDFKDHAQIALISLAAWTFQSLPELKEDFRGLMNQIVRSEQTTKKLWLRLPQPKLDLSDLNQAEALKRILDGFVPLEYHTRSGEDTFAWYRGPFAPLRSKPIKKNGPFLTADAALIYDDKRGIFDASLASAWEIGRAVALADSVFGQTLLNFRQRGHRLTDALLHRQQSDHFRGKPIAEISHDTAVQDDFFTVLKEPLGLLHGLGSGEQLAPIKQMPSQSPPLLGSGQPDMDPQKPAQKFLERPEPDFKEKIEQSVKVDLEPITRWLARLFLLYPVPFHALVADERLLPVESLRFFYVDNNWTDALLDGAMSIGMESSRYTAYDTLTRGLIKQATREAAQSHRKTLLGIPSEHETAPDVISGFLMRSGIVSGWPNLAVRPHLNGKPLEILRMDHLSPNVLLCLFGGVPDYVEFSEPQEGFRFGVDDDGNIALRNPEDSASLGKLLDGEHKLPVRASCLRSNDKQVLNLAPASVQGLIQQLQAALNKAKVSLPTFGPADFALQMVMSPETIKFNAQTP